MCRIQAWGHSVGCEQGLSAPLSSAFSRPSCGEMTTSTSALPSSPFSNSTRKGAHPTPRASRKSPRIEPHWFRLLHWGHEPIPESITVAGERDVLSGQNHVPRPVLEDPQGPREGNRPFSKKNWTATARGKRKGCRTGDAGHRWVKPRGQAETPAVLADAVHREATRRTPPTAEE